MNIKFVSNVNDVGQNFVIEYEAVNEDEGEWIEQRILFHWKIKKILSTCMAVKTSEIR
jgi:hypothetical protein